MGRRNPFRGKVSCMDLNSDSKGKTLVSFDVTPNSEPSVNQKLMCNFKEIGFSEVERRELSYKHREHICYYQNMDEKIISEYSEKLIAKINRSSGQKLLIKASDFGAYICLAAIFSGNLPTDKSLRFELSSVPLSLFPKKLVHQQIQSLNHEVVFLLGEDCWIRPFKSLYHCPDYIQLSPVYGQENFEDFNAA